MDAAQANTTQNPSPRERLLAVEREIGSRVFERREEIRGFVGALLVRAHILFLGKKGAAKSMLGRLLSDTIRWSDVPDGQDPYFRATLGRTSVLDSLGFGGRCGQHPHASDTTISVGLIVQQRPPKTFGSSGLDVTATLLAGWFTLLALAAGLALLAALWFAQFDTSDESDTDRTSSATPDPTADTSGYR